MTTESQHADQAEAIATADAHLSNVALPTYSELVEALRDCEGRLTLLINADRHKLLDVLARDAASAHLIKLAKHEC